MFPCSLRYCLFVPLFPKTPGRPSSLRELITIRRDKKKRNCDDQSLLESGILLILCKRFVDPLWAEFTKIEIFSNVVPFTTLPRYTRGTPRCLLGQLIHNWSHHLPITDVDCHQSLLILMTIIKILLITKIHVL